MDRRLGKFTISSELINDHPDIAREILEDITILRAGALDYDNGYDYVGISDDFEICKKSCQIPEYKAIFEEIEIKGGDGSIIYVPVFKGFERFYHD